MVLDLGGIKVDLIVHPSTHSDDSLFVYIKDLKTMIVGDSDSYDYYNGEVYNKHKIEDLVNFYKSYDYTTHKN